MLLMAITGLQPQKRLNILSVPVEEVFLPYKGYATVEDLFW